MLIKVIYRDGKKDAIEDYKLDELIRLNKIKKFMRSEGWVTIGVDRIREINEVCKEPEKIQNVTKKKKK